MLGVFLPWRGRARLQKLLSRPRLQSRDRISLYLSTVAFQWSMLIITAWRSWARGLNATELGLAAPRYPLLVAAAVTGSVIIWVLQWFNLRRIGQSAEGPKGFFKVLAEGILPRSQKELSIYIVLSVTAGICEEFMYRGFAIAAFPRAGLNLWLAVGASSILFAAAHLYQGAGGIAGTFIVGIVFSLGRVLLGSIYPPIFWHSTADSVAGIAGPRFLLQTSGPDKNSSSAKP